MLSGSTIPTYYRTNFATKLIEYMALGRPVIAYNHLEQSEIIEESGDEIYVEWIPEAYKNAFQLTGYAL